MLDKIKIKNIPGELTQKKLREDAAIISSCYLRPKERPLYISRGEGCYLEDIDGNIFLDLSSGIAVCSTGHCHPEIVSAIQQQAKELLHQVAGYSGYSSFTSVVKELSDTFPGGEEIGVFLTNSGTEAIEGAIKLAKYHTGRHRFIAFNSAFHGRTIGALSLTASKTIQTDHYFPMMPGVTHIPYANCSHCTYGKIKASCNVECIEYLEKELFEKYLSPSEIAAVFIEPVQGEGGYVIPDLRFMKKLREITHKHGILLVADEIQSGIGRTGKFYAIEHFEIVPDIICIAKGIASGLPLGALLAPKKIMTWKPGAHGSTFAGNAVSCAASAVTLKLIKEKLQQNAVVSGKYFLEELKKIAFDFPIIAEVRGLGLMLGIEFLVKEGKPSFVTDLRNSFINKCYQNGLLLLECGKSTVRICPPLIISKKEIDEALHVIEKILRLI